MIADGKLLLDEVSVVRAGNTVVDHVTASVPGGSVAAVVGPNGAGKSSLLGAVAGVLPAAGRVQWRAHRLDRRQVAYMPQATGVRATFSVLEVVVLGRLERLGWHVADDDLACASAALNALGLSSLAERRIDMLSGGQQQLVMLAQCLARQAELLILDEPTSALDLSRQLLVLDSLTAYARRTGGIVLLALHDLSLAARYASRLLLMKAGRLVANGAPCDVLCPETLHAAYDVEVEIMTTSAGHQVVIPVRPSRNVAF